MSFGCTQLWVSIVHSAQMFDKILPVLKEMWFTLSSMKDMQTYIETNFTICKIIEVRGIPQLYKSYTFYFPYTRNLPIQRGRIYVFYMLGGKVSCYLRI